MMGDAYSEELIQQRKDAFRKLANVLRAKDAIVEAAEAVADKSPRTERNGRFGYRRLAFFATRVRALVDAVYALRELEK